MVSLSRGRMVELGMVLLTWWVVAFGAHQVAQAQPAQALPEEVVMAWQKAGAKVGWIGKSRFGLLTFVETTDKLAGAIPAFRLSSWKEGTISKLPHPGKAFGLHLGFTQVTDVGLKELAGLKTLQTLDLSQRLSASLRSTTRSTEWNSELSASPCDPAPVTPMLVSRLALLWQEGPQDIASLAGRVFPSSATVLGSEFKQPSEIETRAAACRTRLLSNRAHRFGG